MKHFFLNEESRFNEVLFENRNKSYGAYALRTEADRILTKSFLIGASLLAAISISPLVASAFKSTDANGIIENPGPFILKDIVEVPDAPPVQPEVVKPPTAPDVKSFDATLATPTRNANESHLKKEIPDDAVAGSVDNPDGKPATTDNYQPIIPDARPGNFTAPPTPVVPDKKVPDNTIAKPSDLAFSANFEGGIDAFRNKVLDKFDTADFVDEGTLGTVVTFVVEKNGTISGVKAEGKNTDFNKEAIRTILGIKGKWSPGKNKDGEAVRSYFNFPIKMRFDQ